MAPTGPYDQDPAEIMAMEMDREAICDYEMFIDDSEMNAYRRCLKWAGNQPWALLEKRAKKNPAFNYFRADPEQVRLQLVELTLEVRLVTKIEKVKGIDQQLYEIWGSTEESGSRLYDLIVIDEPPNMPVGVVSGRAKVAGYFFHMHAYEERGGKPNAKPLYAPLVIGRIQWQSAPPVSGGMGGYGLVLVVATVVVVVVVVLGAMFMGAGVRWWLRRWRSAATRVPPSWRTGSKDKTTRKRAFRGIISPATAILVMGNQTTKAPGPGALPASPGDFGIMGR